MEKNEEFIKKMKEMFIPAVERMVQKEKEHIESLRKSRRIMRDRNVSHSFFPQIDSFIKESERMLEHYQMRLKQYKEYVGSK